MSIPFPRARERYERTRGHKWLRLRHVVLVEEPVCMICGRKPSVEVDHILPVSKGGADDRDNLQGTCKECHEDKTRVDLGLRKKRAATGIDGYPVVSGDVMLTMPPKRVVYNKSRFNGL